MRNAETHIDLHGFELLEADAEDLLPEERDLFEQVQDHVAHCSECSDLARIHESLRRNIPSTSQVQTAACPQEQEWLELAAGFLEKAETEQLLKHAGQCNSCSHVLRYAVEIMQSAPSEQGCLALAASRPESGALIAKKLVALGCNVDKLGSRAASPSFSAKLRSAFLSVDRSRNVAWVCAAIGLLIVASDFAILRYRDSRQPPERTLQPPVTRVAPNPVHAPRTAEPQGKNAPLIASLTLDPGLTRGLAAEAVLKLPNGVESVSITLRFVDVPPRELNVELSNADGPRRLWNKNVSLTRNQIRTKEISVNIPAAVLRPAYYSVSANSTSDDHEPIANYSFRVIR